jgi:hypothetical protein
MGLFSAFILHPSFVLSSLNLNRRATKFIWPLVHIAFALLIIWYAISQLLDQKILFALSIAPLVAVLYFVRGLLDKAENLFKKVAERRALAIAVVTVFALAVAAGLSLHLGVRNPDVTDEFSYLLSADTFLHGRLSNPTHPMWPHFETIHVIHQPTYASKYLPGQGIALAVGRAVGGHPVVGVWLSMAAAAGAICWMLMGWLPARWAMLGGLLTIFHPMFLQWSQSYWGGAVGMIGGALVVGALRRILDRSRARDALVLGAGMLVLAISRPFEGVILSLLVGAALFVWALSVKGPSPADFVRRVGLPLGAALALTLAVIGFYNLSVTGSPLRLPYVLHEEKYAIAPPFVFQSLKPEPAYLHKSIRDIHRGLELSDYEKQQSVKGFVTTVRDKLGNLIWWNIQSLALTVPLVVLPAALSRSRWLRLLLLILVVFAVSLLIETYLHAHYASPVVGLIFALIIQSMRHLNAWQPGGRRIGSLIVRLALIVSVIVLAYTWAHRPPVDRNEWHEQRARMLSDFNQSGERHLVVVRYGPDHYYHQEWVFNEADIDGARVVWAREMDRESNLKLLDYFKGRRAWLLVVDRGRAELSPYPAAQ